MAGRRKLVERASERANIRLLIYLMKLSAPSLRVAVRCGAVNSVAWQHYGAVCVCVCVFDLLQFGASTPRKLGSKLLQTWPSEESLARLARDSHNSLQLWPLCAAPLPCRR